MNFLVDILVLSKFSLTSQFISYIVQNFALSLILILDIFPQFFANFCIFGCVGTDFQFFRLHKIQAVNVERDFTVNLKFLAPVDVWREAKHHNHVDHEPVCHVGIFVEIFRAEICQKFNGVAEKHTI